MIIHPEAIKQILSEIKREDSRICPPLPGIHPDKTEPAAVLIPLILDEGKWKLLFIKRTHHPEDRHSGQIAFPGGRADQADRTLLNTALREAEEEIGIKPADIEILGQTPSFTTVTNYRINPFVGIIPWPFRLRLSKEEVQKTLLIPLDWLDDPAHRQQRTWQPMSHPEVDLPVIFFKEYEGEVLWGATAQIVVDFLDIIRLSPLI